MAKENSPQGNPAPAGAVPLANVSTGVPALQQPQAQPSPSGEGEKAQAEQQSAKRAVLQETAQAARSRANEAKAKADKAMAEAQELASAAAELHTQAQAAEAHANPDSARYVVAEGKSIFALSGQLGAFQEVRERDFQGGAQDLEQHIKSGIVVLRTR